MKKISFIFLLLICSFISFVGQSYANEISSDATSQIDLTNNGAGEGDPDLTVKEGITVIKDNQQNLIKGFGSDGIEDANIILEIDAKLQGLHNTIMIRQSDNVTITNSGSIISLGSKAINMRSAQDTTITNNVGATITSLNNAISGEEKDSDSEAVSGTVITNSGTIFSDTQRAIYLYSGADTATITNNSSGVMYNSNTNEVVHVGSDSTITNSGTIQNRNSPDNNSIVLQGNDNTITLKDKGILVGTIDAGSTTGNTLKFQHGMGQGYYYKTSGDFTLQDLDGNQVVKGSAGSVGQGASETLDELLSYKSINLRNFFSKYNKLDDQDVWGETYVSNLKRDAHTNNLALEYDLTNFGVNLINKIDNANFVIAFEGGRQDFVKDHKIDYQNISAGVYLPQKDNPYFNLDLFILGGITLKDGERTILTNTTTSGKLTIDSDYETYEIHTGIKKNNLSSIPDFGFAASYSMTPSYDESKYFSWTDRHVGNLSIFFEDDYNLINNKDSKLFLGWTLDMRKMMGDKKQVYSINGTSATYEQQNDLTNEISLIANMGYEKKFSDKSKILFLLDTKNTNRYTKSVGANISFKSKF
ncbi:hypothetical protein E5R92_06065 [Candidatus Pelagibacter giovannonii]|uniref:Autotransporter outer membrane beta-barrel domain-containing protein n=1 Tax=Candidatus Pelagibacter giovannonii TaxID=2563896 RepID=A0A6H1Q342_9PROT|nr:hypothetical protein [Candidatus Pelagibacter giovannonii]QIZ21347.1 hypothetical protein E5R92_06065 [Candidatus Pelagibacter giovannonii]